MVFGTRVDQFEVEAGFDGARQGGGETGPAGTAVIFHVGGEQGQGTAGRIFGVRVKKRYDILLRYDFYSNTKYFK